MMNLIAMVCGLLFSLGLLVSGMVDPDKVIGFLNIAGHWDPSLAFVMIGAILTNLLRPPCKTPAPRMNAHFVVFFGAPNPLRNVMVEAIF
jgi:hypothetical protein